MAEADVKVELPEPDWAALSEDASPDMASDDFEEGTDSGSQPEETPQEPSPPPEGTPAEAPPEEVPPAEPPPEETPPEEAPPPVDMAKLRQQEVDRLVGVYAINETDAQELMTEPEKVLPRLAAQVQVNTVEAVVNTLGAQLPEVVRTLMRNERARQEAEDAFYSKFPALKDKKFEKSVQNAIKTVRANDPTLPVADVIIQAGITASLTNKLPLPEEFTAAATPPAAPKRSFKPAQPGASRAPAQKKEEPNEFAALAESFLQDDKG